MPASWPQASVLKSTGSADLNAQNAGRGAATDNRGWFRLHVLFPIAYLVFGVFGVLSSIGALLLSFLLPVRIGRPLGQELIHRLFAFFVWYLRITGLAQFDFGDLSSLRGWRGGIIVANHPCLIDVVLLVSRLPRAFCIMKSGIISNIVLCGTAKLAGYVDNRSGTRMVRECVERISQGESLLIFPEGTRSRGAGVNPFKLGFALVAKRASAPIQTLFIKSNSRYLSKGWPFFDAPDLFPLRYSIRLGQRFCAAGQGDAKAFGHALEDYYQSELKHIPAKDNVQ